MEHQEEAYDYDMQCTKPITLFKVGKVSYPNGLEVPCGKCLACRQKIRKEWSLRMYHELSQHEDSVFLTLTYDDEHLPENDSLVKDHIVLFMKKLRRYLDAEDRKIKYFAVGEYGDKKERPHYHLIVFGLGLKEEDRLKVVKAWKHCDWDNEAIRKKSFGTVEPASIDYVAQYINKKFSGRLAEDDYAKRGREPVFRLMSYGLGKEYALANADRITADLSIRYQGKDVSIPRYYCKLLKIDPELLKSKALEADQELVEKITGVYLSRELLYLSGDVEMNVNVIKRTQAGKAQHDKNLQARLDIHSKKL
nr:MAG: replication initiator protein [Microvirus sp.]